MPHYRVVLESKDGIHYVNVNHVEGLEHARETVRQKFSFEEWRIINVSEQMQPAK